MSKTSITLYGIPNCDTVKKARTWLAQQDIDYVFHDVRKDGLDESRLQAWTQQVDWKLLLNTRGTTWRKLSDAERDEPTAAKARALMLAHPTLIKRPVVETNEGLLVGFEPTSWIAVLVAQSK